MSRPTWPTRAADLPGLRVRTRRRMRTGVLSIPAGKVATIAMQGPGFVVLESAPCDCCGVTVRVRLRYGRWSSRAGEGAVALARDLELLEAGEGA